MHVRASRHTVTRKQCYVRIADLSSFTCSVARNAGALHLGEGGTSFEFPLRVALL